MGLDISNLQNDQAFKQTPLFDACAIKDQERCIKLVRFFIEKGVKATQEDSLKQLPIYYAVREGHSSAIDILIKEGSNVNHLDTYGQTPIFYSIREGNIVTTKQLMQNGADAEIVDNNG
jgi:ankyrin repeat protein